ncbi:MAG: hypothetical protein JNL70_18010 [Saprospiraceae bacterium]|nr:hypothetical protein [Saprospiraceae bacterium]
MKTIQKWAVAAVVLFFASFTNALSAQTPFSHEEMVSIKPHSLDKMVVIHYLKKQFGLQNIGSNLGKGTESTEARVAVTLFKSLKSDQAKDVKTALMAITSKGTGDERSVLDEDAPNLVKCSSLNYPDLWYALELCTK